MNVTNQHDQPDCKKKYIQGHSVECGSPPGVMMADTLSFNAKIGVVDF